MYRRFCQSVGLDITQHFVASKLALHIRTNVSSVQICSLEQELFHGESAGMVGEILNSYSPQLEQSLIGFISWTPKKNPTYLSSVLDVRDTALVLRAFSEQIRDAWPPELIL